MDALTLPSTTTQSVHYDSQYRVFEINSDIYCFKYGYRNIWVLF